MAQINPNIINNVHSRVEEKAQEWVAGHNLEGLFDGLKAQINETEILEVFPDSKEDYERCMSYMRQIDDESQVEEIGEDIKASVKKGQEAWDELFGMHQTNVGTEGSVFRRDLNYRSSGGDQAIENNINHLRGELQRVAPGYYISDRGVADANGNDVEQSSLMRLIDEKLVEVLSALSTLSEYRQELSRMTDMDFQAENAAENASEDSEEVDDLIRPS
jgi:hypothetical protein